MTTPLYILRAKEMGLSLAELDYLSIGFIYDMMTEKANDSYPYRQLATQNDFDKF